MVKRFSVTLLDKDSWLAHKKWCVGGSCAKVTMYDS